MFKYSNNLCPVVLVGYEIVSMSKGRKLSPYKDYN